MFHYANYREESPDRLIPVMRAYPLGVIVSCRDNRFAASHLPFMVDRAPGGGLQFRAHMDAANPQVGDLDGASVYVVFSGPNAYISPNIYVTRQLPTWNYIAVHAEGRCRIEAPGLRILDDIERLATQSEPPSGWALNKMEDRVRKLAPLIRRVIIDVERIEGRFKLSQEKCNADRRAAVGHLLAQHAASEQALLEELAIGRMASHDKS